MSYAGSYATQTSYSSRQLIGLGLVVGLHIVIGYALLNGLGRKVVEVLKQPLEVSIIEEIKLAPPPPPKPIAAPKVNAPPPPFVPPAEVASPTPVQNPITTSAVQAPPAPPAPAAQAAPPAPPSVSARAACPNYVDVLSRIPYPPQAERQGLAGDVLVSFVVAASGDVRDIAVARTTNTVFNLASTTAVAKFKCLPQSQDVRVTVPVSFRPGS